MDRRASEAPCGVVAPWELFAADHSGKERIAPTDATLLALGHSTLCSGLPMRITGEANPCSSALIRVKKVLLQSKVVTGRHNMRDASGFPLSRE